MKHLLSTFGSVVGWSGVLLCFVAGAAKLLGAYYFFSAESMTVFTAGIGLIATGCMAKLEARTI